MRSLIATFLLLLSLKSFAAPTFSGNVDFVSSGNLISFTCPEVYNSSYSYTTGYIGLNIYGTNVPYYGVTPSVGTLLWSESSNETLSPGGYLYRNTATVLFNDAPTNYNYLFVGLYEYLNGVWYLSDYRTVEVSAYFSSPIVEYVEEETESAVETVEETTESVEEAVEETTEAVEETVEETTESVEEETDSAEETASSQSASAYGSITLVQPNSNKGYELVTTAMTWSNAKAYAESQDGYLMEINSSEEQDYIEESLEDILTNMSYSDYNNLINGTIASDGGGSAYLWLGGSDSDSEGVWLWASNSEQFWSGGKNGTAVNGSFNLWGTTTQQNEPDNYDGSQDALALALETWPYGTEGTSSKLGSAYSWNDINANNELYFIIEKDLEAAEEEPSWVPQGWVYYAWPYAYSFSEGRWHFFNESDTQWRVNLTSAAWGELNAASGWNYYAWPYSYSFDEGAWHWYNNDTQWVVDLLTNQWSTFGGSGN